MQAAKYLIRSFVIISRKNQNPIDPALLNEVIKSLQADDSLYSFDTLIESTEYGFSIIFPGAPEEVELDDGLGVRFQLTAADGVFYCVVVNTLDGAYDSNDIANFCLDSITDAARWHEYSDREVTQVYKGHTALTETFISDHNTLLISTVLFTENHLYTINVQNVYPEHAIKKLSSFIDSFVLLDDFEELEEEEVESTLNESDLQLQHDRKRDIHYTNMAYLNLSRSVPIQGEILYLQLHPTKLNTASFNDRFKKYIDCFLWLDGLPAIDDENILNSIANNLSNHDYNKLTAFEGRNGVAIRSAFLCALVSVNVNNIRSSYMRGKNTAHDKRFMAQQTDQEYIDYLNNQYPILTMAISEIEPKRRIKSLTSSVGYILSGEMY